MRALTMNARTVLAASVCVIALLLLVPVAANAQVTIYHVRVTISPKAGSTGPTAVYCDTGTSPCNGGSPTAAGIQVWNLGTGVALLGGQTLVLTQTGAVAGTTFGNFDTSDRVGQLVSGSLVDCNLTGLKACQVTIEVDSTNTGLVNVWNSGATDDVLVNSNADTGAPNHCEGVATYTNHTIAAPNYTLATGYADNVHNCNIIPTPFSGATVFKGAGFGPEGAFCTTNCFDAGVILITGVTVPQGCTLTQGFWKNHGLNAPGNQSNEWPTLPGGVLKLGTGPGVNYTQLQLQSILDTPPKGNQLISLAHQLIAAKLNILNGANGSSIAATIAAADAAIGNRVVPPVGNGTLSGVGGLIDALDDFNSGVTGPGHCREEEED